MDSSDDDKLLPNMEIGEVKTKKMKKASSQFRSRQMEDSDHSDNDSDSDSDLSDSEFLCSVCSKKFSGFIPYKQHEKSGKHAKALLKKKREKRVLAKIVGAEKVTENDEDYLFFIKKPFAVCTPCGKQFGGPESYHMHLVSKTHKRKVLQTSILDQVRDNGEINVDMLKELYKNKQPTEGDTEDLLEDTKKKIASLKLKDEDEDLSGSELLECNDCEKSFTGMIPYTQHIMSKVHAKTIEKNKLLQKIAPKDIQYSSKSGLKDVSTLAVEDGILVCKLCSMTFSGPESAMMHLKSKGHSKHLEKLSRKQEKKHKSTKVAKPKLSSSSSSSDSETPQNESGQEKEIFDDSSSASSNYEDPSKDSSHAEKQLENSSQDSPVKDDSPKNEPSKEKVDLEKEIKEAEPTASQASKADLIESRKARVHSGNTKENVEATASDKNENLHAYKKYKEYKDIMHALEQSEKHT